MTDTAIAIAGQQHASLPQWVHEIRPHQQDAVDEALEHYQAGCKVVFLDGPTGSGKTLIGELIRRGLHEREITPTRRGLYVCSDKSLQDQFCVAPDTRILTADLRYVNADSIQVGDELVGFDEEPRGPRRRRMYQSATVLAVQRVQRPSYRITLADGASVISSAEHRWLVGSDNQPRHWRRTDALRPGEHSHATKIIRMLDVWDTAIDRDAGYLAAGFDGEGHLCQVVAHKAGGHDVNLGFSQNPNEMLVEIERCLSDRGIRYKKHGCRQDTCSRIYISARPDVLRFLGEVRPVRLLSKLKVDMLGSIGPLRPTAVVSLEPLGEVDLIGITTTTGTYVAEGLASHNSGDFQYARVLKGRANYLTLDGGPEVTADDCTMSGDSCMWCTETEDCPYTVAKWAAVEAELAVINTSYLLAEANLDPKVAKFSKQPFIIADEADTLEGQLLNSIQFEVPMGFARDLGLSFPKKGVHKQTLINWLGVTEEQAREYVRNRGERLEAKQKRRWRQFIQACNITADELARDTDTDGTDESGRWLRDYDTKTLKLVPVTVGRYGPKKLWRHGHRWLLMSATLISPDQMADELGLPFEYETVQVPMTFPVENRPIYLAGVADIKYNADEGEYEKLAIAIERVLERHPDERVLVHTVSYALNRRLMGLLRTRVVGRKLVTYDQAREKQDAIALYRRTAGAVLLAPSASRGVDLKDDDCRVVVIAKVPYPSFGDRRVAARTRLPGGDAWYMVQTVRDVVQMTGRAVRNDTDFATTYILDRQYALNVWRRAKHLHPRWWRDAVDPSFNPRTLMKGG